MVRVWWVLAVAALLAVVAGPALADAVMFQYEEHLKPLGLEIAGSNGWAGTVKSITPLSGAAYPGEQVSLDITLKNSGKEPLAGVPTLEVIRFGSRFDGYGGHAGDPMIGGFILSNVPLSAPVRTALPAVEIPAGKDTVVHWEQANPKAFPEFGTYAVILELPGKGRQAVATFARVHPPNPAQGDGKQSAMMFHLLYGSPMTVPQQLALVSRLGYKWVRTDGSPNWNSVSQQDVNAPFNWAVTDKWVDEFRKNNLYIQSNMYGSPRQTVTDGNWKVYNYVHDPQYDGRWGDFVEEAVRRYCGEDGKGPLQIIDYWNEPWEGGGISAWKSDSARYRTLYKILYERAHKGSPHILVGGSSSIMNTVDKFFTQQDWQQQWKFDVLTDHYVQPYACHGPRIAKQLGIFSIETETWLGYSEEELVAAATHFLAAGQQKVNPNHPSQLIWANSNAGPMCRPTAVAANFFLYFTAGRDFNRIVFTAHLPWLYQWGEGKKAGFILAGARHRLNEQAVTMYHQIKADGTISISTLNGKLKAYDLFGNLYPAKGGKYTLPCSMASVYLEAPGLDPKKVIDAVAQGRMERVKPVEFFADDFVTPMAQAKTVDVDVHNVLTRTLKGTVTVTAPASVTLQTSAFPVTLKPGETKTLRFPIQAAQVNPANAYEFTFAFKGDGEASLTEVLHVNTIAYGHPTIDGKLDDWQASIPVIVHGQDLKRDLTEAAWKPWEKEQGVTKGLADVRFMWDEQHFYLAVRDRNKDWKPKPRLTTRDENSFFGTNDMAQTYTKGIYDELPFSGHCLQVGLNLGLPHPQLPEDPRVPRQMVAQIDTDYEYALWGAPDGAEIWRSQAPGLALCNFLPRCLPAGYNGVPQNAQVVVTRDGMDTIYEAAIPLADMKEFQPAAGKVIKLTFALPGSGILFGQGRSRTVYNALTLKNTWESGPSNDIRWGLLK